LAVLTRSGPAIVWALAKGQSASRVVKIRIIIGGMWLENPRTMPQFPDFANGFGKFLSLAD
jgi:hypothetical protein